MSLEWNFHKLEDLINLRTGKLDSNAEEENGVYPFFTCAPDPLKINSFSFNQKAILLAGNNANGNFHINYYEGKFDAYQRTYVIDVLDNEKINLKYLYYALKICLNDFKRMSQGTSTRFLTKKILDNFEIQVPPIETQLKIVDVLDSITNKININQRINKNLLQLVKTIFKNWFVEFEPFDGTQPKDWKLCPLEDICDLNAGGDKPDIVSDEKTDSCIYPIYSNGLDKDGLYGYTDQAKIFDESVTVSARGTIGFVCLRHEPYVPIVRLVSLIPNKNKITAKFLYLSLERLNIMGTGTTQQQLTIPDFKKTEILVPTYEAIESFTDKINPIFNQIWTHEKEIIKLSNLRDTLLPKLMSGEIDVSKINCDIVIEYPNRVLIILHRHFKLFISGDSMKTKIISKIQNQMKPYLNQGQYIKLTNSLLNSLQDIDVVDKNNDLSDVDNFKLLNLFLSAKQVEGCSDKTIIYYKSTIEKMLMKIKKHVYNISTDDLRKYLFDYKNEKQSSKTTLDNVRRIFSSFFSWLEDEDYIIKNPVRRIHRVKTGRVVKEVLTDENLEVLRDNCDEIRDLAMVELLVSTGIRVGELVRLNIEDIDFYERECVVFGKGESERVVYFDARTKIHLIEYLQSRIDENPALFVSLNSPYTRLGISGVETRLRELGNKCNINKVHPHKFRRTMATNAIDKGMPIEQVQKLLGHVQIDTTMQYAMVNQSNVKLSHRKFIG